MELLREQVISFESIKALCTNYKKDTITRKTLSYLEKRLESLENAWVEFHERHEELVQTIQDKTNLEYFVENIYEKTQGMYEVTKRNISELLIQRRDQQQYKVEFDLTNIIEEQNDDKLVELMNTQENYFKALARAMSKVDVEFISEMWEIQGHLSTLKSKWDDIDKLHWKLEGVLKGSPALNEYYSTFENIEKKYDKLIRSLNQKLNTNIHYQRSASQIEIPIFSGDNMQWLSFKDQFTDIIHNNPTLTSCQKMQHLKAKLRGEAERLVQHLPINADNYFSCWDILTRRYDNRRLQFTTIMNIMNELPIIQIANHYNIKKMHDVIDECLNALANMGVEVSTWDPIVVYYMSQKLDSATYAEYTKEMKNKRDIPDLQEFLTFLENKFIELQANRKSQKNMTISAPQKQFNRNFRNYRNNNSHYNENNFRNFNSNRNHVEKSTLFERNNQPKTFHAKSYGKCPLCNGEHVLMQCDTFVTMNPTERNNIIAKLNVCKNCLYSHGNATCMSRKTCKECNLKHHTLIHYKPTTKKESYDFTSNSTASKPSTSTQQTLSSHYTSTKNVEVLLTTAKVQIKAQDGTFVTLRALLDQGSQVNLITENAAQRLRLTRSKLNATVSGVGSAHKDCRGLVKLTGKSMYSDYIFNAEALVLKQITNKLPTNTMVKADWPHITTLDLADPEYYVSSSVDLLLGADVYAEIILDGVRKGDSHSPIAQKTKLGWILCGKMNTFNCLVTIADLGDLSRYWETEDIIQGPADINKDDQCERYYQETTKRAPDGRYIVKMPMIQNFEQQLGKSRPAAISQYLKLENRLEKNEKLSTMYKAFIQEYCDLQHMKPARHITNNEVPECLLHITV